MKLFVNNWIPQNLKKEGVSGVSIEYKLDNLFQSMVDGSINRQYGKEPVKDFPGLETLISFYKTRLDDLQRAQPSLSPGERYERTIIDFPGGDFYRVVWNVSKAKEIIRTHKIEPEPVDLKSMAQSIDQKNLARSRFTVSAKNSEPVIVAHYPPLMCKFIIDGNHRVMAHYLEDNNKLILGYILNPELHIQAMDGELYKALYKIHYNLVLINTYRIGLFSEVVTGDVLKKYLYEL